MPGVSPVYLLDNGTERTAVDQLGDEERLRRKVDIDRAFAYYEGRHRLPLRSEPDGTNSSVVLNLVGQALDDMVDFMGVPRLAVPGGITQVRDEQQRIVENKSPQQKALESWWADHDLAEFAVDLFLSGFIAGHSFVKLYRRADGVPQAELLDPRAVTVFWNQTNISQPLWYRLAWQVGETMYRQDIVPNGLLDPVRRLPTPDTKDAGWQILDWKTEGNGNWALNGQDPWDYPFPPIVEWKNRHAPHQYYGRADARADLNDAINFTASNVQKILKHHAGPQTVVTGATLDDTTQTGPGTIINNLPADAKVFNLEMQSDLSSSLAYWERLQDRYFSSMQVVDLSTVKDKLGQITNFGVRMLFIRMTNMISARRRLYGKGISNVSAAILTMLGEQVERVDAAWPEPLPVNRLELVQSLTSEAQLGVLSKQTASEDLGRDFDKEQANKVLESSNATDAAANAIEALGNRGLFGGG